MSFICDQYCHLADEGCPIPHECLTLSVQAPVNFQINKFNLIFEQLLRFAVIYIHSKKCGSKFQIFK